MALKGKELLRQPELNWFEYLPGPVIQEAATESCSMSARKKRKPLWDNLLSPCLVNTPESRCTSSRLNSHWQPTCKMCLASASDRAEKHDEAVKRSALFAAIQLVISSHSPFISASIVQCRAWYLAQELRSKDSEYDFKKRKLSRPHRGWKDKLENMWGMAAGRSVNTKRKTKVQISEQTTRIFRFIRRTRP